ncbi:hypothetical protein [Lewinella sp. LCG006]|uniref:hypothetical protein n=1 Tax=Lewinella sp. LCG006 TaxID=3231911 RepID=UPI0034609C1F
MKNVSELVDFCANVDNATLEKVVDQIYTHQPFVVSLFLGYKDDVDMFQLDELLRILIVIWLFFEDHPRVKQKRITQKMFEARQKKNVTFLDYMDGEPSQSAKNQLVAENLKALHSKELWTMVFYKFKEGAALKTLDPQLSGIILIGMKSLMECFEEVV